MEAAWVEAGSRTSRLVLPPERPWAAEPVSQPSGRMVQSLYGHPRYLQEARRGLETALCSRLTADR